MKIDLGSTITLLAVSIILIGISSIVGDKKLDKRISALEQTNETNQTSR